MKIIETITDHKRDHQYQKHDLVCYCFEYTRKDIENDYLKNNSSKIMEKIASEKKAGKCNCVEKNPKGQ